MIGLDELAIGLAILGAIMLCASIVVKEYSAQLKSVGLIFFVVGIGLAVLLWLFG